MELVSALRKKSEPLYFKTNDVKIDRANGIIKGVVIGQEGFDKSGEYWDEYFLKQLVTEGNKMPKGLKSRFGHPTMCDTTLGSYIGRFKDFTLSKNSTGKQVVIADLYLDPICKNAPGGRGNLFDYVLNMAEKNDDMFGNSIAFYQNDSELIDVKYGEEVKSVYAIRLKTFDSSDLVDSPCATDELFKDTSTKDLGIISTNFLEENPQLLELLSGPEGKEIVNNFLNKLNSYNTKKQMTKPLQTQKSFLAQMKEFFGGKMKAFEAETAAGEMLTCSDENGDGAAGEGDMITAPDGTPKASATIPMKDGSEWTTDSDGKITAVKNVAAAENTPATESAKEFKALKEEVQKLKEELEASNKEKTEMLQLAKAEAEKAQKEAKEFKEQLAKLSGNHEVKPGTTKVGDQANPKAEKEKTNRVTAAFAKPEVTEK